jgi:site-specific recombinase XerD
MKVTQGLLKETCQFYLDVTYLFVSPFTSLRLTIYKTKQYIRDLMHLAKISDTFGVYSIKHSTIAYLLSKGIPEDVINKTARYSPGLTMVSKQYAITQDQRNVYGLL